MLVVQGNITSRRTATHSLGRPKATAVVSEVPVIATQSLSGAVGAGAASEGASAGPAPKKTRVCKSTGPRENAGSPKGEERSGAEIPQAQRAPEGSATPPHEKETSKRASGVNARGGKMHASVSVLEATRATAVAEPASETKRTASPRALTTPLKRVALGAVGRSTSKAPATIISALLASAVCRKASGGASAGGGFTMDVADATSSEVASVAVVAEEATGGKERTTSAPAVPVPSNSGVRQANNKPPFVALVPPVSLKMLEKPLCSKLSRLRPLPGIIPPGSVEASVAKEWAPPSSEVAPAPPSHGAHEGTKSDKASDDTSEKISPAKHETHIAALSSHAPSASRGDAVAASTSGTGGTPAGETRAASPKERTSEVKAAVSKKRSRFQLVKQAKAADNLTVAERLADAPTGHVAYERCKQYGPAVQVGYVLDKTTGLHTCFNTTTKKSGCSLEEAKRICRLCYLKFEEGWSKGDVLQFREKMYKAAAMRRFLGGRTAPLAPAKLVGQAAIKAPAADKDGRTAAPNNGCDATPLPRNPHHGISPIKASPPLTATTPNRSKLWLGMNKGANASRTGGKPTPVPPQKAQSAKSPPAKADSFAGDWYTGIKNSCGKSVNVFIADDETCLYFFNKETDKGTPIAISGHSITMSGFKGERIHNIIKWSNMPQWTRLAPAAIADPPPATATATAASAPVVAARACRGGRSQPVSYGTAFRGDFMHWPALHPHEVPPFGGLRKDRAVRLACDRLKASFKAVAAKSGTAADVLDQLYCKRRQKRSSGAATFQSSGDTFVRDTLLEAELVLDPTSGVVINHLLDYAGECAAIADVLATRSDEIRPVWRDLPADEVLPLPRTTPRCL